MRSFNLDVVYERQHPESLVCRMRVGTSCPAFFHRASTNTLSLTFKWPLEIKGTLKVANLFRIKSLDLAYLVELLLVMFLTVGVSIADFHCNTLLFIQLIEVITKESTTSIFHFI